MTKRKTVKELNEDFAELRDTDFVELRDKVERIEKALEIFDFISIDNLEIIKKKIGLINAVNENDDKLKEVENKVNENSGHLKDLINKKDENKSQEYMCKKCDSKFKTKALLKDHTKSDHKKDLNCKVCDEIFAKTNELESHLKNHEVEMFRCSVCEKAFVLKWRLKKHEEAHNRKDVKFCHYYNNDKHCPYEDIGCMFKHATSEMCRFGSRCQNILCQFRHGNKKGGVVNDKENRIYNTEKNPSKGIPILTDDNDSLSDSETEDEEELTCEDCGKVLKDFDLYIEHTSAGDCAYSCSTCGKSFIEENDLKAHIEKHCLKCGEIFNYKKALEAHDKMCS